MSRMVSTGLAGMVPEPLAVAHRHGGAEIRPVAPAAQRQQLAPARRVELLGLVEPGALAIQHLIGAQHQPPGWRGETCSALSSASASATSRRVRRRRRR